MHVGLNCVFLVPGETGGMEVYARELAHELPATGVRVTVFANRLAAGLDWGVETVTVPVDPRRRIEWVRGEQQLLPGLARGVDLLHSLASTAPARGAYRRVVTIHDLNYLKVPEAHFGVRSLGMRVLVPLAARTAHRIVADSRSTRDDVVHDLRIAAGKVDVVPLGLGQVQRAAPSPEPQLRAKLGLDDRPVVLTLSAKRPHKNLAGLLRALALLDERPLLVLPGYPTPHEAELRELAAELGVADDVRWPGWLPGADVEGLFALASAFVFPSFYEGFGLPVLEAMTRGVPVACSDRASLPEVAGDAALVFDPDRPQAIADAVARLLRDAPLRERLAAAGRARAATFTWERTARETVAAYERAMRASR
ncbi:MAG: glycosyltransferase family 4 protein [Solirubrobacterales bacterium]|nr:glycosyltransferase family 4 protein [Solirubrobacterales bacterium]